MPREPAEQAAWEEQCFGCSQAQSRHGINRLVEFTAAGSGREAANMAIGSILSDVQSMIERPTEKNLEQARQYLNRVKDAIFNASPILLWKAANDSLTTDTAA